MSSCSAPLAVICAEKVALLHLLHQVPVQPSRNETNHRPRGNYSLSFEQEEKLASVLAFLSNTKNDCNHVPALCVEENLASGSLDVVLIVGSELLEDLKQS